MGNSSITDSTDGSPDHELVAAVLPFGEAQHCTQGADLISMGEASQCFYYVEQGTLEVSYTAQRTPIVVALIGPGSFFGEIGFFDQMTRTRNIKAVEEVRLRVFDHAAMMRLQRDDVSLYARFLEYLLRSVCVRFRQVLSDRGPLTAYAASLSTGREHFRGLQQLPVDLLGLIVFLQDGEIVKHRWSPLELFPLFLNLTVLALHREAFSTLTWVTWIGLTGCLVLWDLKFMNQEKSEAVEPAAPGNSAGALTVLAEWLYRYLELGLFSRGVVWLADSFSRLVGGLHQHLEINVFSLGLVRLAGWFGKAAGWLRRNFEMGFDRIWTGLGKCLSRISSGWLSGVENGTDQKAAVWVEDVMQSVDEREQELQARPLHWDLAWIPILMLVILVFLYFVQGG